MQSAIALAVASLMAVEPELCPPATAVDDTLHSWRSALPACEVPTRAARASSRRGLARRGAAMLAGLASTPG